MHIVTHAHIVTSLSHAIVGQSKLAESETNIAS